MFTYKFEGLTEEDARTPYSYGSLPAKPLRGSTLVFDGSNNRYAVTRIEGEGLVGDDDLASQRQLAWAEIARAETVPTIWLMKLEPIERQATLRSFSYEEVKEFSQSNREKRLSAPAK
ncbi:MAG TPA: hypothetical protein VEO19_16125 [Terriglobia bacterium]|nr:hypothetical protein [Terriglobia bacterium]